MLLWLCSSPRRRCTLQDDRLSSLSHASYTTVGHHDASLAVLASHFHPRCPPPLSTTLLLSHSGEPAPSVKYVSNYSRAFGPREDDRAIEKAMREKAEKRRGREEEDERERTTRDRTYKTIASESYSVEHTLLASEEQRSPFLVKPSTLAMPLAAMSLQLRK